MDFFEHSAAVVEAFKADIEDLDPEFFHHRLGLLQDHLFNSHPAFADVDEGGGFGACRQGGRIDFTILVGPDQFDEIVVGHGAAGAAAEIVIKAGQGGALIPHTDKKLEGIRNAPTGKGADFEVLFIPGSHGNRAAVPFENSFVEAVHGIDKGCLQVDARFRDGEAFHLAELGDDHLLGHGGGVKTVP